MNDASKDVLFTIAMDLDLPSLLRWCQSSARINRDVCNNENVWRNKLVRDYPDYQIFNLDKSLRETYVLLYQLSFIKNLLKTKESLYDIFLRENINLSGKGLKNVPAFDLPNLQELHLSKNQLTKIPTFVLPNLQYLSLSDNQLTEVPEFDLPKLEYLILSNNQLTEVPSFNLLNLQKLQLGKNQLTKIPAYLPKLLNLYLSDNRLTEVPIFELPNLRILYLYRNPLIEREVIIKQIKEKYGNKIILM